MELKQGYKMSEIGEIPSDWKVYELNDILHRIADVDHYMPKTENFGFPYVMTGDLSERVSDIDFASCKQISLESYNKLSKKIKNVKGDIILARYATVGTVSYVDIQSEFIVSYSCVTIKPNTSKVLGMFLFNYFKSHIFKNEVRNKVNANIQDNVGIGDLVKMLIPLPPLKEQTAIANALSDMDALICQAEKLIEKKKAIKQGAMQELLKPKEGWVTKTLGEIGVISGAGVDKKINANENAVRLLNYMDVYKRDFIYSNELSHWVTAPASKLANCSVKQGDVFFTPSSETRTDIGLAAVAMEDIGNAVYSYHVMRFRLLLDWDIKFKAYIFQTKHFLDQTEKMCEGGGKRYVLTMPKFRALLITYPESIIEQQEISWKLWDMDQELKLLSTKLNKLKQQKQGMMQALLTGKIRLV